MGLSKLYDKKLNILAYVILPLCIGFAIAGLEWLYVVIATAIILFFSIPSLLQFYLFVISIVFPLILSIGPINEFPISLIITPLFFFSMLSSKIARGHKILPRGNDRLFIYALLLLFLCLIVGYIRNSFSVFSIDLQDHGAKMVALGYLKTFAGMMAFFSMFWFISLTSYDQNKLLRFFIFVAFALIIVKLTGVVSHLFALSFTKEYQTPYGALRLAGFDNAVWLGIPALIAYSYHKVNTLRALLILVLLILGIMGGGRTLVFGALFSIVIYLGMLHKRYSARSLLTIGIVVLAIALMAQFGALPKQLRRIGGLTLIESGGFSQEDPGRADAFTYYWDIFLKKPLFGKGIGVYEGRIAGESDFLKDSLISGGHSAYLSVLCIFGIAGAIVLSVMLFGGIIRSYRLFSADRVAKEPMFHDKLTVFIMLYLIITAFYYTFGYSGFDDIKLYSFVGMLLGVVRKETMPDRAIRG